MAKKSGKLVVKKETLRQIDEPSLERVAGGTLNQDWYVVKNITLSGTRCTGPELYFYDPYIYYY
jgi:hypothetical protein